MKSPKRRTSPSASSNMDQPPLRSEESPAQEELAPGRPGAGRTGLRTARAPGRRLVRIAVALGVVVCLLVFVVLPYTFAYLLTHARSRPMDRDMATTPASYGVPFRDVQFGSVEAERGVATGAKLSGWYLPKKEPAAVIIYAHGLFRSRQEMLARAATLWHHGYAGLLFDFRRHGRSSGELSSMGFLERLDVEAAVRFARDSLRLEVPIVGFGVSMGAAATVLAAAETPDLDALIIDSSFLSFDHAVAHHLKLWLGLPRFPLAETMVFFTRQRIGFKNDDFDMRRALQRIGDRAVLFIAGGADKRMPLEVAQELYAAAPSSHKSLVVIPNAIHGAAYRTDPERYVDVVLDFLRTVAAGSR